MDSLAFGIALWLIAIACGAAIGHSRNNVRDGILWPAFLGPLGLLIAAVAVKRPTEVRP